MARLVLGDDVERLEVLLDVDAEPGPGLLLYLGGNLVGPVRQVTNMAVGRLDDVSGAQNALQRLGLGG